MIDLDICFSDIPRDKLTKAKNGKLYGHLIISELRETDDRGNTHTIFMKQTKKERENKDKKVYVGKGKTIEFKSKQPANTPAEQTDSPDDPDALPF